MGWLLPALSTARLDTQRGVVLNERRQTYDNRPYGLAQFTMLEAMYPPDHPYHWPTIGRPEDLAAATIDDVRAFFSRYYHPGNASLVIAGDVTVDAGVRLAERLFGEIPAGPPVSPVVPPAVDPPAARLLLKDRVELARLYLAWPSPGLFAPGDAELDLAADILANGRTSRLYKRLVHDRRVAVELAAAQTSRELGGMFQIIASAAPGIPLDDVERAVIEELQQFTTEGPTQDEIDRGRAQAEAAFVFRLQSLGGFGGIADQLNAYNVYRRQPDSFAVDLARYLGASADALRQAAARWLTRPPVMLAVVPENRQDLVPRDTAAAAPVAS
jgi:zinc protease